MGRKTETRLELNQYLPEGWKVTPWAEGIKLEAPCRMQAKLFHEGCQDYLRASAKELGTIEISWGGDSIQINPPEESPPVSSWAPSSISAKAPFEAVLDFVKGQKIDGKIVTITAMNTDKCLMVNDLQALDRGGGWTAQDWVGIDFKTLWRDSFHLGRHNYYGDLVSRVSSEQRINEFLYQIRRPSGALAEYSSNYWLIDNFMGGPVRVAVSKPGDWRVVEVATDGSED